MAITICQRCQQRPATIHVTELPREGSTCAEAHLCPACCHEAGWDMVSPPPPVSVLLSRESAGTVADKPEEREEAGGEGAAADPCPECGFTMAEYRKVNLLGCPHDWTHFADELLPLVRHWHGAERHRGRRPGDAVAPADALARRRADLAARLAEAVADERYEEAARLRDELRRLERP